MGDNKHIYVQSVIPSPDKGKIFLSKILFYTFDLNFLMYIYYFSVKSFDEL